MEDLIRRQAAIEMALEYFAEYLDGAFNENGKKELMARFQRLPSAQPEIIRCKDCGHAQEYNKRWVKPKEPDKWWCFVWEDGMDACDYCSMGERRE